MQINIRKSKVIKIGNIYIGGNNPVAIQSMAKTKTADIERTVRQIKKLEAAGCEIVRLAVKDFQDAKAIRKIKERYSLEINEHYLTDAEFKKISLSRNALSIEIAKNHVLFGNVSNLVEIFIEVKASGARNE